MLAGSESSRVYLPGERRSGVPSRGRIQDFYKIREDCLRHEKLFEDPYFAANDSTIPNKSTRDSLYIWKRPKEIVEDPKLFLDGTFRFDVTKGATGHHLLVAAMSSLSLKRSLLHQVVPSDQGFDEDYAGVFHFRFWQCGKWIDVVIDDRLPTLNGKLVYTHSQDENEFWSSLLEKAYAKLYGSYINIIHAELNEIMEDLTGGLAEQYQFVFDHPNLFQIMHNAFKRGSLLISQVLSPESSDKTEIFHYHAHNITKVIHVTLPSKMTKIRLLRLKNPWGSAEWKGAWADHYYIRSPEWKTLPKSVKEDIGFQSNRDGEFWMSFEDFLENWNSVCVCHLDPDNQEIELPELTELKWHTHKFEGKWVKGITAGGGKSEPTFYMNPQYRIKVHSDMNKKDATEEDHECSLIIGLMQKNKRKTNTPPNEIGFEIYRLDDPDQAPKPLDANYLNKIEGKRRDSEPYTIWREKCARLNLTPGDYCLIPTTSHANEEGEFHLRVFSERKIVMDVNDVDIGFGGVDDRLKHRLRSLQGGKEVTLTEFFMKLAGESREIDWRELQSLLNFAVKEESENVEMEDGSFVATVVSNVWAMFSKDPASNQKFDAKREGFSKELCRSMIAMLDVNQSRKLGFEEFRILWADVMKWKAVFKLYDKNSTGEVSTAHLREALNSAGFRVNHQILTVLVQRYGSKNGSISFDDFLMAAVKLKVLLDTFKDKDPKNTMVVTFTLDEWTEKTLYL